MNIKPQLLKLLEQNKGAYISGAMLANKLSVSRNAIWKAVESLREEGNSISAATNKGYSLDILGSALSEAGISARIKNSGVFHIDARKTVTSTNTLLRELAAKGAPEGYVLVAEEQTAGKGRLGKSFHSPAGCGVYFSLLLRPAFVSPIASLITSAAAVAVSLAIEEVFDVSVGIKWVNDLFVGNKKVCGILTEASFDMEGGMLDYAVLGIGINVFEPESGYPEEIDAVATALVPGQGQSDGRRCHLIAAALDYFWGYYNDLLSRCFLDEYKARSIILGKDIFVLSRDGRRPAIAIDIDDECRLLVRYVDGETSLLASGEVSINLS